VLGYVPKYVACVKRLLFVQHTHLYPSCAAKIKELADHLSLFLNDTSVAEGTGSVALAAAGPNPAFQSDDLEDDPAGYSAVPHFLFPPVPDAAGTRSLVIAPVATVANPGDCAVEVAHTAHNFGVVEPHLYRGDGLKLCRVACVRVQLCVTITGCYPDEESIPVYRKLKLKTTMSVLARVIVWRV
jgi:hypothetical protein